jgi:hypothetical protein
VRRTRRPGDAARYGGGLGGETNQQMIAYLKAHRDGATWLVAVQGSSSVLSWVEQNCTAVSASAYSSSANSGAVTGTGGLYRCG